jgi:hypothetical protein
MPNQFTHPVAAVAPPPLGSKQAQPNRAERRLEARYPTQDPAEIEILPGPSEPLYGTILDISRSGLRVALRKRVSRGEQLKVKLHRNVIFAEVRYCRSVPDGFQAGLKIQDLVRPAGRQDEHIADDPLSLYAVGKGLSVTEVIEIREHLLQCESCRARVAQQEAMLNPGIHLPAARPRD